MILRSKKSQSKKSGNRGEGEITGVKENQESVAYKFEDEVFFSLQNQRNKWAIVAVSSLAVSLLSVATLIAIVPLKQTKPYVVLVDKTTGEAEKIVEVLPVELSEREAVQQAELVSYVTDRETYDISDNAVRIPEVLAKSRDAASADLKALWTSGQEAYPPDVYGEDSRVTVKITSSTVLEDQNIARVRFTKTRETADGQVAERKFVATVGFGFDPSSEKNLDTVWKNPLGFYVNSYRIDAETLNSES